MGTELDKKYDESLAILKEAIGEFRKNAEEKLLTTDVYNTYHLFKLKEIHSELFKIRLKLKEV